MSYATIAFVVGLLIAIHEFGHLLAAKLCGIPIKRFSVGFGPRLFGFTLGPTSYWFSWIPLGGYVWPALEDDDFRRLPAHKRIAFALGGPAANIVAAFLGLLTIGLSQSGLAAGQAVSFAANQLVTGLQQQLLGLSMLFSNFGQMSGIVGIVAVGGERFGSTVPGVVAFAVLINLSLAVLNLLPLPPLDGGRVLFAVLEKLCRPIARLEVPLILVGWALLMVVMVSLTIQDIGRIVA